MTMVWSQLWSQRFCWMVNMALTGLLRFPKRFGLRSCFTLLRTMSCLRVFSSSQVWSLLVLNAKTGLLLSKLLTILSSYSAEEFPLLFLESCSYLVDNQKLKLPLT